MNWPDHCAAVVPCLNEARTIAPLVRRILHYLPAVYVVDDGSSDETAFLAAAAGAAVLKHDFPRGKGLALETGLARALADGFSWTLCLDGDGQHDPADIPQFLHAADSEGAALVVGNRMHSCKAMPFIRRFVNRWMSRRLSNLCGHALPDSQCGFRLVQLQMWSALSLKAAQFEIESEMLVRFFAARHRIAFVPVRTIYGAEQSKIHPLRDSVRWFTWFFRVRNELNRRKAIPAAGSPDILSELSPGLIGRNLAN